MWIAYAFLGLNFIGYVWSILSKGPIPIKVSQNRQVTLQCMLPFEDSFNVNVHWLGKNGLLSIGTNMRDHHREMFINKPAPNEWNLVIRKAKLSFEDIYTCKTGNTTIISFNLIIQTPPRINESASTSKVISVLEGKTVELTCIVTGNPKPKIDWFRGVSETAIGISGHVLRIPNVTRYASGEYMCRAHNIVSIAKRRFRLTVKFPPKAEVIEKMVYTEEGEVTVLACVVQGLPPMDVFWLDNKGSKINDHRNENIQNTYQKYSLKQENADDDIPVKFLTLIFRKNMLTNRDFGNYTCMGTGINSEASAVVLLEKKTAKTKKGGNVIKIK